MICLLIALLLIPHIISSANFEKYEPDKIFTELPFKTLDTCVCVPDSFNGVESPVGCFPYDGCLGTSPYNGPCDDGIDNDCDCKTDCSDPQCGLDCDACDGTCDDPDCSGLPLGPNGEICSPGGEPIEFCYDDFDNDNDNYVDECDANCNGGSNIQSRASPPYYASSEVCDNKDNDCDGSIDEGGVCSSIACYSNSNCGNPYWKNTPYCSNDDIYD
ncbi:MAG: hypothetical protein ABIJ08_02595, partial [Nanoarchaeota archaeon]